MMNKGDSAMIRPIIYTLVGIPLLVYACYFVALGMFSLSLIHI